LRTLCRAATALAVKNVLAVTLPKSADAQKAVKKITVKAA